MQCFYGSFVTNTEHVQKYPCEQEYISIGYVPLAFMVPEAGE